MSPRRGKITDSTSHVGVEARTERATARAGDVHGAHHSAAPFGASAAVPRPPKRWDRMTREEQREYSAELAIASRRAAGLPDQVEDPAFYEWLGRHLRRIVAERAA